jgi:hypothetical protein
MSEKKVVGRNVAIALGIIAIILLVGLAGVIANYTSVINAKDNLIASKDSEITNKNSQIADKDSQISSLNSQIADLKNQIDSLKAPKLIKVDLRADDNRPWLGTPYLHVYGYLCNVGTNWAYNCKLHVVAYQSGGVEVINTYISLDPMNGEWWRWVDSKIYYSGSALVNWTITPEWTATLSK